MYYRGRRYRRNWDEEFEEESEEDLLPYDVWDDPDSLADHLVHTEAQMGHIRVKYSQLLAERRKAEQHYRRLKTETDQLSKQLRKLQAVKEVTQKRLALTQAEIDYVAADQLINRIKRQGPPNFYFLLKDFRNLAQERMLDDSAESLRERYSPPGLLQPSGYFKYILDHFIIDSENQTVYVRDDDRGY